MGLTSLLGGVAGAALGGPLGGIAGSALGSALGGGATSVAGGINNAALSVAEAASNADQTSNLIANMHFNSQMMWQQTAFNQLTEAQSQKMQQVNVLRDIAMQQRKADDSITKEFITTIKS